MGIILALDDQIKLLKDTAIDINERIKYLAKVDFDECLLSYVEEISGIEDIVNDSCILTSFPDHSNIIPYLPDSLIDLDRGTHGIEY